MQRSELLSWRDAPPAKHRETTRNLPLRDRAPDRRSCRLRHLPTVVFQRATTPPSQEGPFPFPPRAPPALKAESSRRRPESPYASHTPCARLGVPASCHRHPCKANRREPVSRHGSPLAHTRAGMHRLFHRQLGIHTTRGEDG